MAAPAALGNGLVVMVEAARFEGMVVTALDGLLSHGIESNLGLVRWKGRTGQLGSSRGAAGGARR